MSVDGNWRLQEIMLQRVADALGADLLREVAFVGGCTTGLLITDPSSLEAVRFTEDVDLIVHVVGTGPWYALQQDLVGKGFRTSPDDDVICRMRLRDGSRGELMVDFMPDDAAILGFSNRWYADALRQAGDHALPSGTIIRVVAPALSTGQRNASLVCTDSERLRWQMVHVRGWSMPRRLKPGGYGSVVRRSVR